MGLFINTNVASINARRQLMHSTTNLSRSFERLSSGLRVNSAKDDAAGLAISNRFTSQIRGLNQAVRNSNDGISLAQTVEGALQESTNILQRMRELAVQAANDTNTASDRESLDAEVQQLVAELDRIGETTTFNNQKVLDGSFVEMFFHVGANARETVNVRLQDARSTALGRAAIETSTVVTTNALADGDVIINSINIRATQASDDTVSTTLATASAMAKANAINDSTAFTGVTARALATEVDGGAIGGGTLDGTNNVTINGQIITGVIITGDDANENLLTQINAVADETGVIASLDANHELVLTARDGRNIEITASGTGAAITGLAAGVYTGALELSSTEQFLLEGAQPDYIGLAGGRLVGVNTANSVSTVDVMTRQGANRTIEVMDRALEEISSHRADLGALQNRLQSTISNLSNVSENLSASRSRILDADFAAETAALSRNQVLQQAGTSILAQANQQPQQALSLLQ
ncbi:flagellin [Myxococcota bacterium]|nr:flagellin [Myxococcota bacterium]MBU1430408.1 flagellin [Myxococcota bacterium]MBU1898738.1 flagellin [Myxococcota bacterium]